MSKPKKKTKSYEFSVDPLLFVANMWFWLWLGSGADNWVHAALVGTGTYAFIHMLRDISKKPKKEDKDEVSEMRGPKS